MGGPDSVVALQDNDSRPWVRCVTSDPESITTPAATTPGVNGNGGLIWYPPRTNSGRSSDLMVPVEAPGGNWRVGASYLGIGVERLIQPRSAVRAPVVRADSPSRRVRSSGDSLTPVAATFSSR